MGADQSKDGKKKGQYTQEELERVLQMQREQYDAKLRDLSSAVNTQSQQSERTRLESTFLQQQKELYEKITRENQIRQTQQATPQQTRYSNPYTSYSFTSPSQQVTPNIYQPGTFASSRATTSTAQQAGISTPHKASPTTLKPGPSTSTIVGPSATQPKSLERNRTPYSYTGKDLPSVNRESNANLLYPNLNNNNDSNTSLRNRFQSSVNIDKNNIPSTLAFTRNDKKNTTEGFVFVERPKPSAPSAEEVGKRNRSKSRNRFRGSNANDSNNDEDDELKCPTCSGRYGLTIYQCSDGHSSCKLCKMSGAVCGICRQHITDMRNITLEAYVAEKKVPCTNVIEGCTLLIKMSDMEAHLKGCTFSEQTCPIERCFWKGKLSQIASHFDSVHPQHRRGDINKEMYLPNITAENKTIHLVEIGPYNFLVHIKVDQALCKIYMMVQLLGSKSSASKWSYELHIYNKREPRRKYQYSDICHPSCTRAEEIYNQGQCAVIPIAYAMSFFSEGRLNYKFYIKKDLEEKRGFFKNYRGRGRGRGHKH